MPTTSRKISNMNYSYNLRKLCFNTISATPLVATLLSAALLIATLKCYTYVEQHAYPSLTYPLSAYNMEVFAKTSSLSDKSLPELTGRSVYGPLQQQPPDSFQPFNTTSLVYVAGLFLMASILCM